MYGLQIRARVPAAPGRVYRNSAVHVVELDLGAAAANHRLQMMTGKLRRGTIEIGLNAAAAILRDQLGARTGRDGEHDLAVDGPQRNRLRGADAVEAGLHLAVHGGKVCLAFETLGLNIAVYGGGFYGSGQAADRERAVGQADFVERGGSGNRNAVLHAGGFFGLHAGVLRTHYEAFRAGIDDDAGVVQAPGIGRALDGLDADLIPIPGCDANIAVAVFDANPAMRRKGVTALELL